MPISHIDVGDQRLLKQGKLTGRFRDPVFNAVYALAITKFAMIEVGATARAICQAFGASLRADVEGLLQPAAAARITSH